MNLQQSFLDHLGIEQLNQMQVDAFEVIVNDENLELLAKTGTGKTLAYLLPIVHKIPKDETKVRCLIMVPSRELALQVERTFRQLSSGLKVLSCYGGHAIKEELNSLKKAPAVIIGTPGRLAQHIYDRNFDESTIDFLVIDEFDKCLELGFLDDIGYIHNYLTGLKQHVLTSATPIEQLPDFIAGKNLRQLNYLDVALTSSSVSVKKVYSQDKFIDLFKLVCSLEGNQTVVFATERSQVEDIADYLRHKSIQCSIYHGKLEQDVRERELLKFANGTTNVLVTTDLAGRGLDIPSLGHIIHFTLPVNEQGFVHRNGRTARMNANGNVYVLLGPSDEIKYLAEEVDVLNLEENYKLPAVTPWFTLYFSAGRKDKISKGDLAGFLMKIGGLIKEEVGMIEVKDRASYVGVSRNREDGLLEKISNQKIKGKKIKIEIAK